MSGLESNAHIPFSDVPQYIQRAISKYEADIAMDTNEKNRVELVEPFPEKTIQSLDARIIFNQQMVERIRKEYSVPSNNPYLQNPDIRNTIRKLDANAKRAHNIREALSEGMYILTMKLPEYYRSEFNIPPRNQSVRAMLQRRTE